MENNWFQNPWATNQWMPGGAEFEKWAAPISDLDTDVNNDVSFEENQDTENQQDVFSVSLMVLETNVASTDLFAYYLSKCADNTNNHIIGVEYENIQQMAADIHQLPQKLQELRMISRKIKLHNLILVGHGTGNSERPSFRIGRTRFSKASEIIQSKELKKIGAAISGSIYLLTCNSANQDVSIVKALAKVTGRWVYGSKSWIAAFETAFGTSSQPKGKWLDYLDTTTGKPTNADLDNNKTHQIYYEKRGHWLRVKPDGDILPLYRLRINYDGGAEFGNVL